MITCYSKYTIDPFKLKEFEHHAKLWIPLVEEFGGTHHGYFLPLGGPSNIAVAMFSFPSLGKYETKLAKAEAGITCSSLILDA